MTAIKHAMTREPVTVHVDLSLVEAAVRMRDNDIGALFVVDGDELVGVVTDRDLAVRGTAAGLEPSAPVIEVMTRHVVFLHEDRPLADAAGLMGSQRIRRVAIVDAECELVGVFSLGDLARLCGLYCLETTSLLGEICAPSPTAKTPAREDPTGGRRRGSPSGELHVYAPRPKVRRRPAFDA